MKNVLKYAAALAMILSGVGCDYNEENFEGLQEGTTVTDIISLEMTLTDADYKATATNSANKALAGEEEKDALAKLESNKYFTPTITAAKYVPNYLAKLYPTVDNTSSIKVTSNYKSGEDPQTVAELQAAEIYKLANNDYQIAWGADSEYNFFTPAESPEKHLGNILASTYDDAEAGDLVWVDYNVAATEPLPSVEAFAENFDTLDENVWSNVVTNGNEGSAKWVSKSYSGNWYVQCSSNRTSGVTEVYLISPAIEVTSGMTFTFDACYGNYREAGGRVSVLISADIADTSVAAIKAATWTDITASVSIPVPSSTYGTLGNVCTYNMDSFADKSVRIAFRYDGDADKGETTTVQIDNPVIMKGVKTSYSTSSLLYKYSNSKWSAYAPYNVRQIIKSDFVAMGSKYDSFDASFKADNYMPALLAKENPYALADDQIYVAYKYYDSGSKTRSVRADEYNFDGANWIKNNGVVEMTDQFVKRDNKWLWDPSVTIVLPAGKGQPLSTLYFQACVDWVKENVEDGANYISSYGNNDYYSGASAYQGNLDWRVSSAREQYAAAFEGMTDDEVTATLKERTIEVFGEVLSILHSDAKPVEGIDVTYTIQFYVYTGVTLPYEIVYKVVAPGEFEYVEDSFKEIK